MAQSIRCVDTIFLNRYNFETNIVNTKACALGEKCIPVQKKKQTTCTCIFYLKNKIKSMLF